MVWDLKLLVGVWGVVFFDDSYYCLGFIVREWFSLFNIG